MDILMIGCGNMGGAMLRRWVDQVPASYTAVNRTPSAIPAGAGHAGSPDALSGRTFDAIVIAVKPQQIADVVPAYMPFLKDDGCLISIAAGFSIASMKAALGDRPAIRIMPNLPAQIGRGVNGLYADPSCSPAHRDLADRLAKATGSAIWLDTEDEIDRITAVAGSGTGYVFEIARAYVAAAERLGFAPDTARTLVIETLAGAVEMAARSETSLEDLRNSVMSKKGTTEAGIHALRRDGLLEQLLVETTEAAYARACELR